MNWLVSSQVRRRLPRSGYDGVGSFRCRGSLAPMHPLGQSTNPSLVAMGARRGSAQKFEHRDREGLAGSDVVAPVLGDDDGDRINGGMSRRLSGYRTPGALNCCRCRMGQARSFSSRVLPRPLCSTGASCALVGSSGDRPGGSPWFQMCQSRQVDSHRQADGADPTLRRHCPRTKETHRLSRNPLFGPRCTYLSGMRSCISSRVIHLLRVPVVGSPCGYASSGDVREGRFVFDGATSVFAVIGWALIGAAFESRRPQPLSVSSWRCGLIGCNGVFSSRATTVVFRSVPAVVRVLTWINQRSGDLFTDRLVPMGFRSA